MKTVYETILSRRSIRRYSDQEISEEDVRKILTAGMSGPTAVNARDWQFVTIQTTDTKEKLANELGRPAEIIRGSKLLVLICGDLERAMKKHPEFWIIDGSIAGQNMILTAESLGIGSVWLGVWPKEETSNKVRRILGIPDTAVPHSLIAFGYPEEGYSVQEREVYEPGQVHAETWRNEK